jgi:hypothetical protein
MLKHQTHQFPFEKDIAQGFLAIPCYFDSFLLVSKRNSHIMTSCWLGFLAKRRGEEVFILDSCHNWAGIAITRRIASEKKGDAA